MAEKIPPEEDDSARPQPDIELAPLTGPDAQKDIDALLKAQGKPPVYGTSPETPASVVPEPLAGPATTKPLSAADRLLLQRIRARKNFLGANSEPLFMASRKAPPPEEPPAPDKEAGPATDAYDATLEHQKLAAQISEYMRIQAEEGHTEAEVPLARPREIGKEETAAIHPEAQIAKPPEDTSPPKASENIAEKKSLPLEDVKELVTKQLGGQAKINALNVEKTPKGLQVHAELDAGMLGGKIVLDGQLTNGNKTIKLEGVQIKAGGMVKSMIQNRLGNLDSSVKAYLEKQFGKPIASMQLAGSNLEVEFASPTQTPVEDLEKALDKGQEAAGIEKFLAGREAKIEAKADKAGIGTFVREIGASYNKLKTWQKIAIGGALAAGAIGSSWAVAPTLGAAFVGGIYAQRFVGGAGMFVKFEKHLQDTMEGKIAGGRIGKKAAQWNWYKKLAAGPEWQRTMAAAGGAVLYSLAFNKLIGEAVHLAGPNSYGGEVVEWLKHYWSGASAPEHAAAAAAPAYQSTLNQVSLGGDADIHVRLESPGGGIATIVQGGQETFVGQGFPIPHVHEAAAAASVPHVSPAEAVPPAAAPAPAEHHALQQLHHLRVKMNLVSHYPHEMTSDQLNSAELARVQAAAPTFTPEAAASPGIPHLPPAPEVHAPNPVFTPEASHTPAPLASTEHAPIPHASAPIESISAIDFASAHSGEAHIYAGKVGEKIFAWGSTPQEQVNTIEKFFQSPDVKAGTIVYGTDNEGKYLIPFAKSADGSVGVAGTPVRTSGFFGFLSDFRDAPNPVKDHFAKVLL